MSKLHVSWGIREPSGNGPSPEGSIVEIAQRSGIFELHPRYGFPGPDDAIEPGMHVHFLHKGGFACTACGRAVKKLFESYCFPCFRSKAEADRCVMSPHLCHYAMGTCREPSWGESFCFTPHFVYVAFTDKYKVGITRATQIPARWIDQGATMAMVIARVHSRHQAGVIEHFLKGIIDDKSQWQRMLQQGNSRPRPDEFRREVARVKGHVQSHETFQSGALTVPAPAHLKLGNSIEILEDPAVFSLEYPLSVQPGKVVSKGFDKAPDLAGRVTGIKGQYLLFEDFALNVRRHEGYVIDFSVQR